MNGEAAKGVETTTDNVNDAANGTCIVRFRPCAKWSGEYGFDWVREGSKDYEERLSTYKKKKVIKDKASLLNDMEWIDEKRENLLDTHHDFNKRLYGEDFPRKDPLTPEQWDLVFDALAEQEIIESNPSEATEDNQNDATEDNQNDATEDEPYFAPEDNPIEYLYAPEHVSKAVYRINRNVSDVWTCDVYYDDMANGDDAANNKNTIKLDHFVYFDTGERLSLLKEKEKPTYKAYLYEENKVVSSDLNSKTRYRTKSSGDKMSLSRVMKGLCKGVFNNNTEFVNCSNNHLFSIVDRDDPFQFIEYEDFRKAASYKSIQFEEDNAMYDLMYRVFEGIVYLKASLSIIPEDQTYGGSSRSKMRKYDLRYENGNLKKVKISSGDWQSVNHVPSKDLIIIKSYINDGDNIASNIDMTIDMLAKSKGKKNVVITIGYPGSIKEVVLKKDDGFEERKDKNNLDQHDKWNGLDIYSWMEDYEDTFPQRFIPKKIEKEVIEDKKRYFGINSRGMYLVPILSICCEPTKEKRTRFRFGDSSDPPKTVPEKKGEYGVQLRVEGKCKTLYLKSTRDDVQIDQTEIQNPQDKTKLKVTFCGKEPCTASINATATFDDGSSCFAGALAVIAREIQYMYITFVTVKLDDAELPSEMQDAIKDNEDALCNALSAAGIIPDIEKISINVKSSEIRHTRKGVTWDHIRWEGDYVFVKKYAAHCKNKPMLRYRHAVFFFPGLFFDCAAYAYSMKLPHYPEKLSYVVESQSFASNRISVCELAHELLHRLSHPHNFQMYHEGDNNKKVQTTPYCFPIKQTTNIMDYFTLSYSLHKYQWDLMKESLESYNKIYYEKLRKNSH